MTLEDVHKYGINTATREIYLHGVDSTDGDPGVEYQMATLFIKNMHVLEHRSNQPIIIHATSVGGEWESGMAMFDAISASPCPVTMYGYGDIASMMSIIFQSADLRVMMPNSVMTLHYGESWYSGVAQGMEAWNRINNERNETMFDIYADVCARSRDIDRDMVRECLMDEIRKRIDWFITPQEAVTWGLADCVYDA